MSTVKTRVDSRVAEHFLANQFGPEVGQIEKIRGGELAEAFFFEADGVELVLRIHSRSYGFIKDRYAFEHFRSHEVPIPEIVKYGRFEGDKFYAVSRRAPGVTQAELSVSDRQAALPSVLRALDAVHGTDVSHTRGYGHWRGSGSARRKTPRSHLESAMAGRNALWAEPYVDQGFHRALRASMRPLIDYMPDQRFLVHGDFGHDNLMIAEAQVSAVLDWGQSAYGDFMHDVAWLDFWDPDVDFAGVVREHYRRTRKAVPHYEERLRLHKLAIASGSLDFFLWSGQEVVYRKDLEWIKSLGLV